MPKIGVISRTERDFERDSKLDMNKVYRSTNANIHKFQKVSLLKSSQSSFSINFRIGKRIPKGSCRCQNGKNIRPAVGSKYEPAF